MTLKLLIFCSLSQLHQWVPGIKDPYKGTIVWTVPENVEISVTMFRVSSMSVATVSGYGIHNHKIVDLHPIMGLSIVSPGPHYPAIVEL